MCLSTHWVYHEQNVARKRINEPLVLWAIFQEKRKKHSLFSFTGNTWFISSQETHQNLQQKILPLWKAFMFIDETSSFSYFFPRQILFAWKLLKYISQKSREENYRWNRLHICGQQQRCSRLKFKRGIIFET